MNSRPSVQSSSWWKQHKSAVFIFALFILGIFLLLVSTVLHSYHQSIEPYLGKHLTEILGLFITELCITAFVGGIAAIFLSLPDVKHHLASTMSDLFSRGQIVDTISENSKRILSKEIVRSHIISKALEVDDALFDHFTNLSDNCLSMIHLYNHNWRHELTPYPNKDEFLIYSVSRDFTIKLSHLNKPSKFDTPFFQIISIQYYLDIKDEEFLLHFSANIGDINFTRDDVSIKKEIIHEMPHIGFEFNKSINLYRDTTAKFSYKIAYPKKENTAIVLARYPTLGFTSSLTYSNQFEYTGIFFKSNQNSRGKQIPGLADTDRSALGITVTTLDWVLPGEGIFITWTPK